MQVFRRGIFFLTADTTVDILTLLVNCAENSAGIPIETVSTTVITDLINQTADRILNIDICAGADLSCHHNLTCCAQSLYSHMALRVTGKEFIKQRIADLVCHLIGMAFGN